MVSTDLTTKEKSFLEDALEMENLCITKYKTYADQCQDGELRNLLSGIAKNKRQHISKISRLMGKTNFSYH